MHDLWVSLTNEQHRKDHSKFLRFRPSVGALKSTDGHLTVQVTARLAKKNLATLSGSYAFS
jgi:hypothetical protein